MIKAIRFECPPVRRRGAFSIILCLLLQGLLLAPLAAQELSVDKSASMETVGVGGEFSYSIEVTNTGDDAVGGIRVRDEMPNGVMLGTPPFPGNDWDCGDEGDPIVIICEYDGELGDDASTSALTLNVVAPPEAGALTNVAEAESEEDDADSFPYSSDSVNVTVVAEANLAITLTGPLTDEVNAETEYAYTITVENGGPSIAEDIEVSGSVPPEAHLLSASGTGWDCRANLVQGGFHCTRTDLGDDSDTEIAVSVLAPRNPPGAGATGTIESGEAVVSSATDDPDETNNTADPVETTVNPELALAIDKDSESGTEEDEVTPGEIVEYEIRIDNPGPTDAVGDLQPLLNDIFPNQLGSSPNDCQGLSPQSPCWACTWNERPSARARVVDADPDINGLGGVRHVVVSPDNQQVYATGQVDNQIAVFERNEDRGLLFGTLTQTQDPIDLEGANTLAISPTGLWLAAAGTDELVLYERDPDNDGVLDQADSVEDLNEPGGLVFSADGRYLYLAEADTSRIRIFAVDESDGELDEMDPVESSDESLLGAVTALAISPDGGYLYAASPGDTALVSFAIEDDGGLEELGSIQPETDGGQSVALRALAVSTDGEELYVAGGGDGSDADALFVFPRNSNSGLPDDGNAQVFVRDAAAGRLLGDIRSLSADPEGAWLIASAAQDQAIALFERQDSTAPLNFVRAARVPAEEPLEPPGSEDDALSPAGMAMDRNGEHLYVAANNNDEQTPLSAIVLYDVFGAGGCNDLRPGDLAGGDIDNLSVRVPAGQVITVNAYGVVNNSAPAGSMINTAVLNDIGGEEIDSDDHEHEIIVAANIQVEKTPVDEFAVPVPGEPFRYRIRITNSSGLAVDGLGLTDTFPLYDPGEEPAGFIDDTVFWTCSAEEGACCNPGGGSCGVTSPTSPVFGNIIDKELELAGQTSITIIAEGILHQDATGMLSNTASAAMPDDVDAVDPDSLTDAHNVNIEVRADAWIEKESLGVDETNVAYRLLVGNNGPGTLNGLGVEDALDDLGLDESEASWSCAINEADTGCCGYDADGSCLLTAESSGPVDMELDLQPEARATFLVDVPLSDQAGDAVTNTAMLELPDDVEDPDAANNQSGVTTRLVAEADLQIDKEIQVVGDAVPGEEVAFEIEVTNDGPDDVFVGVQDVFPPDLEQVAWTCDATSPVPGDLTYRDHFEDNEALLNAADVVTSADGRHVYVSSRGGSQAGEVLPSTVIALERDNVPGDFFGTLVEHDVETDGINDPDDTGPAVEGIAGAAGMALSHDQRHLYVTGPGANAVAVFSRKHLAGTPQFGELTFIQARANGSFIDGSDIAPVAGLGGARAVVVSPDDAHVYVVGEADDSVAIFRRDSATGALGYLSRVQADDLGGDGGLEAPTDLVMDPEGQNLYVSARGAADWFDSTDWIRTDEDSAATGDFSFFVANDSGVAGKRLEQVLDVFVPEEIGDLDLAFQHRYSFDTRDGNGDGDFCRDIGVLELSFDGGESWMDIKLAGGQFDGESGYNGEQDGQEGDENPLLGRKGWCFESQDFENDEFVQVTVNLAEIDFLDNDAPIRFRWILGQGEAESGNESGWWIDDIQLTSGDDILLEEIVDRNPSDSSLVVLARDDDSDSPDFGDLEHVDTHRPESNDGSDVLDGLNGAVAVAMDAGGENVYVAGRNSEAIVVFQRDENLERAQDFRLDDGDFPETALAGLVGIAVSPDGEHLVATGRDAGMLTVLRRASFSGELTAEQVLEHGKPDSNAVGGGLAAPSGIAFSPDDQHVYTAAGGNDDLGPAIGIFERRAPDPTFGFLEAVIDDAVIDEEEDGYGNDIDGLLGARAVAVSTDGEYVYAVGFGQFSGGVNGSLVVLKRHHDRGDTSDTRGQHLKFLQALKDGQNDVEGLDGPTGIAMADNHLYVSSERDNAVAVFEIDENNGEVEHVESYFNGQGGVGGLLGAAAVAVSENGDYVYVAGRFDHSIAIFERDDGTGELTFHSRVQNGIDGIQGLAGVSGLAVSAGGGHHLYATARQDHALVVFSGADDGELAFEQVLRDGVGGEGLEGAIGVAVVGDGADGADVSEHVLVTSPDLNSIAVFRRQTDSTLSTYGHLTFVEDYRNGDPGIEAMGGARAVAVDRDGSRVYVVGQNDNSLVIFERHNNPSAALYGRLAPLEVRLDGVGVEGLQGPYGVAVSPDDRHIYTASLSSHSVAAFIRRSGSSCGTRSGLGNLDEEVLVAAGGTVTFLVTGRIRSGATGMLENTANLFIPQEVTNTCEPDPPDPAADCEIDNSEPTDLVPESELAVDKTNGRLSVVAGSRQEYRITIDNAGPSDAVGVTVTDLLSEVDDLVEGTAAWACTAVGSGLLERRDSVSQAGIEIDELAGLAGVAWAADPDGLVGERVFTAGVLGDAVSSFEFDPDSGQLEYFESLADGGTDAWDEPVEGLRGARDLVTSSDGRFVYATSQVDDAVVIFEVETDDDDPELYGHLRVIGTVDSGMQGMSEFNQPQGLSLSPDEARLYVTSANDDALYVFERAGDGSLTFAQRVKKGIDCDSCLGGASAVAASGDGAHVYVSAANDNAVTALTVDPDSGELEWLETRRSPGTTGLVGAVSVALDPVGSSVYVAGRDSDAVVVFQRNDDPELPAYGQLGTPVQVLDPSTPGLESLRGPRQVMVSADGENVYVVGYEASSVYAFKRDREDGQLSFLARYRDGSSEDGLTGVSSLSQNESGSYVFTGALLDAAVASFSRPSDSLCSEDSGIGELDEFVVDVAAGGSVIIDLEVDIATGAGGEACPPPLDAERECVVNTVAVDIPNQAAFEPVSDNDASYLTGAANLTISKTDGLAEFRGLAEARAAAVTAEGDGYLYVAAPGEPGIGVYRIEEFSGPTGDHPLSFVQVVRSGESGVSGLNGISDLVLTSDAGGAAHLYASAALDSSVVWFRRNPATGMLEFVARFNNNTDGITGISGASALALSPDQRHLYVAGRNSDSIAIFSRQHDSEQSGYGDLTFQGLVQNGTGGVAQLVEPADVMLDAGGNHLYAAAQTSSAIVVFRRQDDDTQPDFGGLELIQVRQNGAAGVTGLLGVSALRVDASGGHLYAAGSGNHSLVHFTRDSDGGSGQFGHLNFVARYTQGEDGIDGLTDVSDLMIADGGGRVYATSPADHAVAVFARDVGGGALTWLARIAEGDVQGDPGNPVQVDGLGGARGLAEDPTGRVLVAGRAPGSLAVLVPEDTPALAFTGAMLQGGGGAAPGDEVTYTITIVNEGPSDVVEARVRDIFPLEFEFVEWTCVFEGGTCVSDGSGNIDTLVSIEVGGQVTFQATGTLRPDITGTVVNEASVTLPANVGDEGDPVSNVAVDDDTVLNNRADLAIAIEDLPQPMVAGADIGYRLRVTNTGPSEARGSRVRHTLSELFAQARWECTPDREPGLIGFVGTPAGDDLSGYGAAAMSPDGRHVYAVGIYEGVDSMLSLRRDTLTGELTPISVLQNGDSTGGGDVVDGLDGGAHVVVSADGAHVYVAGRGDDAVAVFERDIDEGGLHFVQVVRDNIGAVEGLGGVSFLALSLGGTQLYAAGTLDNAVAVFDRDVLTGALDFVQVVRNGTGDVIDLVLPQSLAISPDGNHLYVAAPGSDAVVRFERTGNGQLSFVDRVFQGQQQLIGGEQVTVDGLTGVRSLAFAGTGNLYVVSSTSDTHALTRLLPEEDGALRFGGVLRDGEDIGVPPQPISGLAGAETVAVTADSRQLYVTGVNPDNGLRTIAALRIVDGLDLQFLQQVEAGDAGDPVYPQRLLISADNRHLYSAGGQAAELDIYALQRGSVCGREGNGGVFDVVDLEAGGEVVYDISTRVQANARGVVTGDARVDAATSVNDLNIGNNVAEFETNLAAEAAVEVTKTRLTEPLVAGLPASWEVTVENHGPSTVRSIAVQDDLPVVPGAVPAPGQPGAIAGSAAWVCDSQTNIEATQFIHDSDLSGIQGLAYSIDGRWLLAASAEAHSISLYERMDPSGWLELSDRVSDGDPIFDDDGDPVGEVSGLLGASAVAVSTDLRHVYVAGRESDAVAVFELDSDAGVLHFVEWRRESESSVNGMMGPMDLTLAPDGLQLYVAARDSDAVTVFERNPESGRLQWLESRRDGQGNVPLNALVGVRDLVLSPDGDYLYAAATQSHAITVFRRDLFSGQLGFVQRIGNGDLQGPPDDPTMVAGLQLVRGIALSPQGGQLYAASLAENSITLLTRNENTGVLTFERLHVDGQNDIEGLAGPTAVAVSPDGEQVYAAGLNSGEVVVLDRDWSNGHLNYLERRSVGEDGIANPQFLAIDPDGRQLAVSSSEQGGAIVAMRRLPEGYCGIESLAADSLVDVIDLAAGGSLTYTVDTEVHPGARGELVNIAEIELPAGVTPLTPDGHSDSDARDIEVETELRIVKEVDEATLVAGLPAVYTLVVNNEGPSHALTAQITDIFPPELPQTSWSCAPSAQSSCTVDGEGDVEDTVDVLVDGTLVYTVDALVDPGAIGQATNTATATAPQDGSDPDLENNTSSVTTPIVGVADLTVNKSAGSAAAAPGDAIQFFIVVDNLGPSDAVMARLHDVVPTALEQVQWTCEGAQGANCPIESGSGDVLLEGLLVAGGRWQIVIDAEINADAALGLMTNTATVSVAEPVTDPESSNDQSSANVEITTEPDPSLIFRDAFEELP